MKRWQLGKFGLEGLELVDAAAPEPGPGEVRVDVRAVSINYRDLAIVEGSYNPRLELPVTPLSDAAGIVEAIGEGVTRVAVGDRVMSHFVSAWIDGPYDGRYLKSTLGTPAAGVAAEQVILPAEALVAMPDGLDFGPASTLPIAALTAWGAVVVQGGLGADQSVLTLGTGGVSLFVVQIAKAIGARVIVTSKSDAKLDRARALGADDTINYVSQPDWEREVFVRTEKRGVDLVVETGGSGTIQRSLKAVRPGGTVVIIGSVTGRVGEVDLSPLIMKHIRLQGILVSSRAAFEELAAFVAAHQIAPVIDRSLGFDELPAAFARMRSGEHFGKIVLTRS